SRYTTTQQARAQPSHCFTANRPRGHAANCVPYLTPPVLANVAAFFAKPLPLGAWPAALPWEHSSRWSYLLPAVAHIQMRTMLGSVSLAMAARLSTGAISFR